MKDNKGKQYYLTVKNTFTGKYEKVFVSEEIYRAYIRFDRAEKKRKQRMMRCTVPNEKGNLVRCQEDCSKCEALRLGLIKKPTPLSIEALIEQDFDIPDPDGDIEESILERRDEEEKERLYKAIEQLTPRQQEMVRLFYFEKKSQREIAEILGIDYRTVQEAMERLKASLKRNFEKS